MLTDEYFSIANINLVYDEIKKGKLNSGLARISRSNFEKNKAMYFDIINKKILSESYRFTPYKEILLIKNKNSKPRVLSIPTIRDKITLGVIKNMIEDSYSKILFNYTVENIVNKIKDTYNSNKFDYFIKLDMSNFYGNIDHNYLLKILSLNIQDKVVLNLIYKAITTVTVNENIPSNKREEKYNKIGVPQGLSISNILANIYMSDFDVKHYSSDDYAYFRYVDDILILCKKEDSSRLQNEIESELINKITYNLKISEEKKSTGELSNGFDYLGYTFLADGTIDIPKSSILKVEKSIEKIFNDYQNSKDRHIKGNIKLLAWKINLKISGCFMKKKQYGWVKFYRLCEVNKTFYRLDLIVLKLIKRYKMEKELIRDNKYIGKKFSKSINDLRRHPYNSGYVINFNKFDLNDKKELLKTVCRRRVEKMNDFMIEYEFDRFVFRSISEIEQDLQQIYM